MLFNIIIIISFLSPSIKLQSGKEINLIGKGPPILFSTGLYGTMPNIIYSKFINNLKNNFTLVTIKGIFPILKEDVYDIVNTLSISSIVYMSHSSFIPNVLDCDKINKAILLDPICIPEINIYGIERQCISVKYPVLIMRADKLYNTKTSLPTWQDPLIIGNVTNINYNNIGHPDVLDNIWADIAKKYGFWDCTTANVIEHKKWKYNSWKNTKKKDIYKIRNNYRINISKKIYDFIMT